MQFFYWLIFLMTLAVAIFAVQNSAVPLITIRFHSGLEPESSASELDSCFGGSL